MLLGMHKTELYYWTGYYTVSPSVEEYVLYLSDMHRGSFMNIPEEMTVSKVKNFKEGYEGKLEFPEG